MEIESSHQMLDLIAMPAFAVRDGLLTRCNAGAARLLLEPGMPVKPLIRIGAEEYEAFRGGCLYLTLCIGGEDAGTSVSRIGKEDIFVLEQEANQVELQAMALAAKELRAPLASVMTVADRLFPMLDKSGDPDCSEQIARINRGLFQMLRVIGNMSDAARFRQPTAAMQTVDVGAHLDELFAKAAELVRYTGIELTFENDCGSLYCLADPEKLERAVYNILSNAIKFTPKNGKINAKFCRKGKKLYLSVQDSGAGIPSALLGQVYTRFQRQPSVEDSRYGIGLGMVLIMATATLHGGTVLIDQPENAGTRITMTLEIRQREGTEVRSPVLRIDYAGERDHGLIELSQDLPASPYEKGSVNG